MTKFKQLLERMESQIEKIEDLEQKFSNLENRLSQIYFDLDFYKSQITSVSEDLQETIGAIQEEDWSKPEYNEEEDE